MRTRIKKRNSCFLPVKLVVFLSFFITAATGSDPEFGITYKATKNKIEFFIENPDYIISNVTCKSYRGTYTGTANNTCEKLEPCVLYTATLNLLPVKVDDGENGDVGSGNGGVGVVDHVMEVNTSYALPQVNIVRITPRQFSILIEWTADNRQCVANFEVVVKSPSQEFKNNLPNDKDSTEVQALNPCQAYDVYLKVTDVNGTIVPDPIERKAETEFAEPEDITGIRFVPNYETKDVTVLWDPPKYKTCIRFYTLKWNTLECIEEESDEQSNRSILQKDDCKWNESIISDANVVNFAIKNLDGCENYALYFYINGEPGPKSEINSFESPEQQPGLIEYEDPIINITEVTVVWRLPTQNKKCVDIYNVHMIGPLQRDPEKQKNYAFQTKETTVKFISLDPCGKYNISVQPIGRNGSLGQKINSSLSTNEDKPSEIRNLSIDVKPTEFHLEWDPPEYSDLCLEGYRIAAWNDSNTPVFNKDTNETEVVIDHLISCMAYSVQIIAFTKTFTKDGAVMSFEQITSPMVASPPINFQFTAIHSHSLELSAIVDNKDYTTNNCQTLFARFVCSTKKNVPYTKVTKYVEGRLGGLSFMATILPLSPFTDYVCQVDLFNTAGWSNYSEGVFTTDKYFPEIPLNVSIKSVTTTALSFQWNKPVYPNGNINVYMTFFSPMYAAYYIPPHCKAQTTEPSVLETTRLEVEFSLLVPFSYYSVQIAAKNEYGTGDYTLPAVGQTLPSISESVTNLKVVAINGPDVNSTTYKANVTLSWLMPCRSHGNIEKFLLKFKGTRDGHAPVKFERTVVPIYDTAGIMTFNETELSPEYDYEVCALVYNKDVIHSSEPKTISFQAPSGIPEKIENTLTAKVDAFEARNPTQSAVVSFPVELLKTDSGTIIYAALLISQKNCNPEPELKIGALDTHNEWPDSASWADSYSNGECIHQYQTTPIRWQPMQPRSGNNIEYIIGDESCSNVTKRYCNGPLKADTEYEMVIRLFTKSSFSDAAVLEFKTDSLIKLTLIWISIISCLLVAFVAGFLYLYITKKIIWHRESGHGIEDSFGDITSKNFAIFYNELSKRDKIQREFKELTVIATDFSFSASETNEYKNRYRDIFPYDKNRVILDVDSDGNDYINASFINGYRRKKEYIATQGPKQESIVDFWRMVIQHNVKIIVMVTSFKEDDTIKCNHYYPYEWKNIKVEIQKEDSYDLYDRREMIVTHAQQNIRRKIIHFYFKKWLDHGVPMDPMNLITFVRKVKAEKCPSGSPIVVHCSAGVGRTGTFIGLDIIMQRLKSESKINIFETVKELRFQRMKMVQSMQQYTFLYKCAFELVKHKRGKLINNTKKVSFENDEDTAMESVPKVTIMDPDTDSGNSYENKNLESII